MIQSVSFTSAAFEDLAFEALCDLCFLVSGLAKKKKKYSEAIEFLKIYVNL